MEMLVTLAFALVMLIPIVVLVYLQTSSGSEQLAVDQAQQSVNRLKNVADTVGAQGPPSKATVNVIIPSRVNRITVGNGSSPGREIVFTLRAAGGTTDIVATTLYNVTGVDLANITRSGTYPVSVEAVDNYNNTGLPCVVVRPA